MSPGVGLWLGKPKPPKKRVFEYLIEVDQYFSGSVNIHSPTLTLAYGHLTHFQRLPGAWPMAEHLLFPLTRPNYVSDISGMVPQRICFFSRSEASEIAVFVYASCFCIFFEQLTARIRMMSNKNHMSRYNMCVCVHAYKQSHIFAHGNVY